MTENTSQLYWKSIPNRDEALERIYAFLKALSDKDADRAASYIQVKDMHFFLMKLHDSLLQYLDMVIEDEEWEDFEGRNLAMELDDPSTLDEDLMLPEFTGKHFELVKGEELSVQVGMRERVTPIRLHFVLDEADELYFLRIHRITAK